MLGLVRRMISYGFGLQTSLVEQFRVSGLLIFAVPWYERWWMENSAQSKRNGSLLHLHLGCPFWPQIRACSSCKHRFSPTRSNHPQGLENSGKSTLLQVISGSVPIANGTLPTVGLKQFVL